MTKRATSRKRIRRGAKATRAKRIATRGTRRKRRNGIFSFLTKKRVTYHGRIIRAGAGAATASATRGPKPLDPLRQDVASALMNQGVSEGRATAMARRARGNDFESMFRSVMKRNPSVVKACVKTIASNPRFRSGDKVYRGFRFHPYQAADDKYHWHVKSAPRERDNVSGVFGPFESMDAAISDAHEWIDRRIAGNTERHRFMNPGHDDGDGGVFSSATGIIDGMFGGLARNPMDNPADIRNMTAGQLNSALDRIDAAMSKVTQQFIDAGRGHERPSEYLGKSDPLSMRAKELTDQRSAIRIEMEMRYGPGVPSHLPKGFGPLKRNPEWAYSSEALHKSKWWYEQGRVLGGQEKNTAGAAPDGQFAFMFDTYVQHHGGKESERRTMENAFSSGFHDARTGRPRPRRNPGTSSAILYILWGGQYDRRDYYLDGNEWVADSSGNTVARVRKGASASKAILDYGKSKLARNDEGGYLEIDGNIVYRKGENPRGNPESEPEYQVKQYENGVIRWQHRDASDGSVYKRDHPNYEDLYKNLKDKFGGRFANKIVRDLKRGGASSNRPKSNPESTAASLSETFHGRPAETVSEYVDSLHIHGVLTELGDLVEISVETESRYGATLKFATRDGLKLASSEDGRQLYIQGKTRLDLRALHMSGSKWERDLMVIGRITHLVYRTAKAQDGGQITDYIHASGENLNSAGKHYRETDVFPTLLYDTLNNELQIAGGQQEVREEGIIR